MYTSQTVTKIAPALLKAQTLMGAAVKGSQNPYFKSKYADLGAVLEACKELLNTNGVVILQPHVRNEYGTFVETVLLHESGEFISSLTPVIFAKESDPQAQGSAITYARRYGLQSLLSMPAEDDDGEKAVRSKKTESKTIIVNTPNSLNYTVPSSPQTPSSGTITLPEGTTSGTLEVIKPKTTFRKPKSIENSSAGNEQLVNGSTTTGDDLGLN